MDLYLDQSTFQEIAVMAEMLTTTGDVRAVLAVGEGESFSAMDFLAPYRGRLTHTRPGDRGADERAWTFSLLAGMVVSL